MDRTAQRTRPRRNGLSYLEGLIFRKQANRPRKQEQSHGDLGTGDRINVSGKEACIPTIKPLPAPNSDFYQLADVLTPEEKAIVKKVRTYMETKVQPVINKYWSDDAFPFELLPSFKELQFVGLGL